MYDAWLSWCAAHKNHRIKSNLGYLRVNAKNVKHLMLYYWNLWQDHEENYVYPILRRFERLGRRRLTKAASDAMPDLFNAEFDKAMIRIFSGNQISVAQFKNRKIVLENAFNTWAKRQAEFKLTAFQDCISHFSFMMGVTVDED